MKSLLLAAAEGTSQRALRGEHYVTSVSLNGTKGKEVAFETRSPAFEVTGHVEHDIDDETVNVEANAVLSPSVVAQYRLKDGDWLDLDNKTPQEVIVTASKIHNGVPMLKGFVEAVDEGFEGTPADYLLSERPDMVDASFNFENVYNIVGEVGAGISTDIDAHGEWEDHEFELNYLEAVKLVTQLIDKNEPELLVYQHDKDSYMPEFEQVKQEGESIVLDSGLISEIKNTIDLVKKDPEIILTKDNKGPSVPKFG